MLYLIYVSNNLQYLGIPGCGGIYTSATGLISSPGHSSSYEPNMECEWQIQLPAGERIRASWLRFDLETSSSCQFDFVEVIFSAFIILMFHRRKGNFNLCTFSGLRWT